MYVLDGPVCFCWFESGRHGYMEKMGGYLFSARRFWGWAVISGCGVVVVWRPGYSSVVAMAEVRLRGVRCASW